MVKKYIPQRGDIVYLSFDPALGHEQKGKRPALVISFRSYNEKVGLGLFLPITSIIKNYPFEFKVNKKIKGVVLCDQIKSFDWERRNIKFIEKISAKNLEKIIEKFSLLIK